MALHMHPLFNVLTSIFLTWLLAVGHHQRFALVRKSCESSGFHGYEGLVPGGKSSHVRSSVRK